MRLPRQQAVENVFSLAWAKRVIFIDMMRGYLAINAATRLCLSVTWSDRGRE